MGLSKKWNDIKNDEIRYRKYKNMEEEDKKRYENNLKLYKEKIQD